MNEKEIKGITNRKGWKPIFSAKRLPEITNTLPKVAGFKITKISKLCNSNDFAEQKIIQAIPFTIEHTNTCTKLPRN
jgi:hypothetical protein